MHARRKNYCSGGFLIGELRRLFKNSLRKNIWAAIVSSVVFAGAHTHYGLRQVIPSTLLPS